MNKKNLTSLCPCCGLPMRISAMSCLSCGVKVEGEFPQSTFGRLSPEDQQFLQEYLMNEFSIKALEQNSSMGYAAIRSRLDKLIANYKALLKQEDQKKAILEQIRSGRITVAEAKKKLEKL